MKTKINPPDDRPTEEEIREYAHHLYVSSGWLPGRDLDNWLEAEATLIAERQARHPARQRPPRTVTHQPKSTVSDPPELHSSR